MSIVGFYSGMAICNELESLCYIHKCHMCCILDCVPNKTDFKTSYKRNLIMIAYRKQLSWHVCVSWFVLPHTCMCWCDIFSVCVCVCVLMCSIWHVCVLFYPTPMCADLSYSSRCVLMCLTLAFVCSEVFYLAHVCYVYLLWNKCVLLRPTLTCLCADVS